MQETLVQFLSRKDPLEKEEATLKYSWASLVAQLVKNLPASRELPDPGVESTSPALQADSLLMSHQ